MKVGIACISVALTFAAAANTASAADWNNGDSGLKDMGGGAAVAVPAPVPVPRTLAEWYVGIAAGGVLSDESSISSDNPYIPVLEEDDRNNTLFGGISAGRYLTPSLRAEIAFDFYDHLNITDRTDQNYTAAEDGANGVALHYRVARTDKFEVGRTTGLFNLIYDIPLSSRFKPYVGAGAGFSWRSMRRNFTETAVCDYQVDHSATPPSRSEVCSSFGEGQQATEVTTGSDEVDRFDVALALMAGISWEVSSNIFWDNGYQLLWERAGIQQNAQSFSGHHFVKYEDSTIHQFRTGVRYAFD